MKSIIFKESLVPNIDPHPLANSNYLLVYVEADSGNFVPTLFTAAEVDRARQRALRNPEDSPKFKLSWFERLVFKIAKKI